MNLLDLIPDDCMVDYKIHVEEQNIPIERVIVEAIEEWDSVCFKLTGAKIDGVWEFEEI